MSEREPEGAEDEEAEEVGERTGVGLLLERKFRSTTKEESEFKKLGLARVQR